MPIGTYSDSPDKPSKYELEWYSYYSNTVVDYGERNSSRMAAYHRMDVGMQFHKKKKWGERTWEISFYNAYNRKNPFFYYIENEYYNENHSESKLKQVALFPIIPSVSYGFKF